jgi:predicted enzyme related to lactoylglutathione lyase
MPDKVVHFEIPVDNLERAQGFYRDAFGWKINAVPGMGYVLVETTPSGKDGPTEPGAINGGMLERQEPIKAPVLTVQVDDIDASLERIKARGVSVVRGKEPVGENGVRRLFQGQ